MTIEVYGGYGEVGGNCVVVKDRDTKIMFDNGIKFHVLRRYYRGRIHPLGPIELRSIGAVPPLEAFDSIDALYISHLHLDHLGLLGVIPPEVRVFVPSVSMLKVVEDWYRTSPTWLSEVPHKSRTEVRELTPYREDDLGVTPIPVSHSAYPSYAFTYRGHDRNIFYSGDLRIAGPLAHRVNTVNSLKTVLNSFVTDIALIEGTNIGGVETPIGPEEFKSILNRVLMSSGLVIISVDPLDFEMLTAISELASLSGRTVAIASSRLVSTLPYWLEEFATTRIELSIVEEVETPSLIPVKYVGLENDVLRDPGSYLLVQEPVWFIEMLRRMKIWGRELSAGSVAILTTPEPMEAEAEVEEEALSLWLHTLGVQVYRVRLSGHYYPHELGAVLEVVKPKKLVPIHTKHSKLMSALSSKYAGLRRNS